MQRLQIIKRIASEGIVAVIRAESKEQGLKIVDAVKNGGIKMIEVTMTVPDAVEVIKNLTYHYKDEDVVIGAGTVLDPETARICILAGAKYIVSPSLNLETVKLCNRYRVPIMPGIMNISEAITALEAGVEIVKVFPGSAFGPDIIKAFKGPVPQGNYMPTGGVTLSNVQDWIKAGAIAVGTGGDLTKGAISGDYKLVTITAQKFVNAVKEAKSQE